MSLQNLLISTYSFAKARGLLESRISKWLFWHLYVFYKKLSEDDLLKLYCCRPELFTGGHIIDVGANVGYTSKVFSQIKDKNRTLFSFEPEPWNYKILSAKLGQALNVELLQKAVGETSRTARLWVNSGHHADHRVLDDASPTGVTLSVDMVSIDDFLNEKHCLKPISFIKIDVQGYELKVCQGMERTLSQNDNLSVFLEIICENEEAKNSAQVDLKNEIFSFFLARGFKSYFLKNGQLAEIKRDEVSSLAARKNYVDILFTRRPI